MCGKSRACAHQRSPACPGRRTSKEAKEGARRVEVIVSAEEGVLAVEVGGANDHRSGWERSAL